MSSFRWLYPRLTPLGVREQIGDDWQQDTGLAAQQLRLRRYLVQTGKYRPGDETRLEAEGGEGKRPEWCGENFAAAVEDILGER